MAVDVRGHLDVRVSQPLLHVLQPVALRQQHAGAGVAQVVESDVGQVVLLQQLVEGVAHIVGGVGVPVLPGEYVVVVYVVLAEVVAVVLFLLKQDLEQPYRIVCQGNTIIAALDRIISLSDGEIDDLKRSALNTGKHLFDGSAYVAVLNDAVNGLI